MTSPDWPDSIQHPHYSGLSLHRKCAQAWAYSEVHRLETDHPERKAVRRELGSWWHAVRAVDAARRAVALDSLRWAPPTIEIGSTGLVLRSTIHRADEGGALTGGWHVDGVGSEGRDVLTAEDVIDLARDWWESLPVEVEHEWIEEVGEALPDGLARMDALWCWRWADSLAHEVPVAVEVQWERPLFGSPEEWDGAIPEPVMQGTADEVFIDLRRNLLVIRDHKGLALDTPLPTPTGWTTMKDLSEGDYLIGSDGRPARVTAKSEVHHNPCYRVTFEDGEEVIADHEHRWVVYEARNGRRHVWTTEEVRDNLREPNKKAQRHLYVPATRSEYEHRDDLLVDPYVLGAWVGDGTRQTGVISKPLPALWEEIGRRGYEYSPERSNLTRTVYGLRSGLRRLGVLDGDKMIPARYLRASVEQRMDLLRGLMDTDGHWNKARKQCVLTTVDEALADQYHELITSLGWRARVHPHRYEGFGVTGTAYRVTFTPDEQVFLTRQPEGFTTERSVRSGRRLVLSVEAVETIPTQCVAVDSPDHTYLFGRNMIATHNTHKTLNQSAVDDLMDSQLQIYGWGLTEWVEEWGLGDYSLAVAYDRVRVTPPKQPVVTKSGTLSKSVTDYDLLTYQAWAAAGPEYPGTKKDGSGAGTYEAEEAVVDRLRAPAALDGWTRRTLTPLNLNTVRSHLRAARTTWHQTVETTRLVAREGEAPRNLSRSNCGYCDFADLCRAEMAGGPGGDYDPGFYGLRPKRD